MKQEELQIHGSMFILLKKFVEHTYNNETWLTLLKKAGLPLATYEVHKNYPLSEMYSIIKAASEHSGLKENEIKEKFGEYLVPDLLKIYGAYVKPEWKTFEMLANTELVMHKAVRKEESKADPPVLKISMVHDKLIMIDYYSKRKMASLAIGIIKGIAKFYNEADKVTVVSVTDPDDERVQLRVEFK